MSDAELLAAALDLIRLQLTNPEQAHFETNDGSYSGFHLNDVTFAGGLSAEQALDLTVWRHLKDAVDDLVIGIAWDGVMHEDDHGYAEVSLEKHP